MSAASLSHGALAVASPTLLATVGRDTLGELSTSARRAHGVGFRVYDRDGALAASAGDELALCADVGSVPDERRDCLAVIEGLRGAALARGAAFDHPCFSGLSYRVEPIRHEGEVIGIVAMGPYRPRDASSGRARSTLAMWSEAPARTTEEAAAVARQLAGSIELLLFHADRARYASEMHVASLSETYRALEEKSRTLEKANARLLELDRLKSNFLATVSHELKTPLTSVLGYSEMLIEEVSGPLTDDQRDYVRVIQKKGEELLELVASLLDLSKLERGAPSLQPERLVVRSLEGDLVHSLQPLAQRRSVALSMADVPEEVAVYGDAPRLRQVLTNLVDNALKFTKPGGSVTVRASAAPSEGLDGDAGLVVMLPSHDVVEISVVDTGIGIAEDERERVFEAFYQVDSSATREHGGAGIGLSVVDRIIRAHGGSVRVTANEPTGTVVTVTLPADEASARRMRELRAR